MQEGLRKQCRERNHTGDLNGWETVVRRTDQRLKHEQQPK